MGSVENKFHNCPECGSGNLNIEFFCVEDGEASRIASCDECGFAWADCQAFDENNVEKK
jgi:transcription elongation factor Elf1